MDLRGHGESGWSPDGKYRLERFAADVVQIVEHLGTAPVLVGASLGCNASLAALGHRPELAPSCADCAPGRRSNSPRCKAPTAGCSPRAP
ncbi:alpha/beta fold hydrolase [Streptomyces sp. NPDC096311]|uniref:alpha/beta fold hydrolase n=1 Tax=Streptomyces sp. NPDC096311 TaxID=3366083 RepID=UPI00382A6F95